MVVCRDKIYDINIADDQFLEKRFSLIFQFKILLFLLILFLLYLGLGSTNKTQRNIYDNASFIMIKLTFFVTLCNTCFFNLLSRQCYSMKQGLNPHFKIFNLKSYLNKKNYFKYL